MTKGTPAKYIMYLGFVCIFTFALFCSSKVAASFTDMNSDDEYYDAISYLQSIGTIEGYADGTFKPDQDINRAEVMKILIEGLGITPSLEDYSFCFDDVQDDWYAPYVCYAKAQGWVSGYEDGYFRPANPINRVEATKMVINTQGFSQELSSNFIALPFTDVDSSEWYAIYLDVAENLNLVTESSGAFHPSENMTRGYLSEMIFRGLVVNEMDAEAYSESLKEQFLNPTTEIYIPTSTETGYENAMIEDKELFIISDEKWEDVLEFLPVVQNHPYLLIHKSGDNFDIDSAIYFIEDYAPSRITLIGDFSGVENYFSDYAGINNIEITDSFEYWDGFDSVIYASANYQSSLLSTPLAAFKGIPFVVENSSIDMAEVFEGRTVYLVDGPECPDLAETCVEMTSETDIPNSILEYIDGDKIILTNPSDIDGGQEFEDFESAITGQSIGDGLSKDSLVAAILSVQKRELIIPTYSDNATSVQSDIDFFLDSFSLDADYLTILANPDFINQANYDEDSGIYYELDNAYYGDLNGDYLTDLKVGRIYGITVTDTSSTVARSVFYQDLNVSNNVSLLWVPDFLEMLSITYELESWFDQAGYQVAVHTKGNLDCDSWEECYRDIEFDLDEALEDQSIIVYQGHGSTQGGLLNLNISTLRDEDIQLNSSLVVTSACSTCAYTKTNDPYDLFCLNILRRGAVAYLGAIEDSASNIDIQRDGVYDLLSGDSLGEILKSFKERSYYRTRIVSADTAPRFFDSYFVLLGDPTLTLSDNVLNSVEFEDSIQFDGDTITIEMPEVNASKQFDFNFYSQSEYNIYGTSYFDDLVGNLVMSGHSLIGELTSSNGSVETRTSYEYLFSIPVSIDSVSNYLFEYSDGRESFAEEPAFIEDNEGNTWFWFEEVFYDINDSGGVPARTITIDVQ
ncbi:MAG: S-layer homology domain-containing protein [Candidatus Gracilibacteria bacterium]